MMSYNNNNNNLTADSSDVQQLGKNAAFRLLFSRITIANTHEQSALYDRLTIGARQNTTACASLGGSSNNIFMTMIT